MDIKLFNEKEKELRGYSARRHISDSSEDDRGTITSSLGRSCNQRYNIGIIHDYISDVTLLGIDDFADEINACKTVADVRVLFGRHFGEALAKDPTLLERIIKQIDERAFERGRIAAKREIRDVLGIYL